MILAAGEILFDHFPGYRRVGGAPLNFSWHLKKLGLPVRFITRVGNDPEGRELLGFLRGNQFEESDQQVDEKHPTGAVNVTVDVEGAPTFEILRGAAFDYLQMDDHVRSLLEGGPQLIYFGTLIQRTESGRRFVEKVFSRAVKGSRFFCDLNLRPGCYSADIVQSSLEKADILKLNEEELASVLDLTGLELTGEDPCPRVMERFGIELLALTRGSNGSEIHRGKSKRSTGPVEGIAVADTVGAGDAYASMLAAGYLMGWTPKRMLTLASRFSADICEVEGALPERDQFYDKFKKMVVGE